MNLEEYLRGRITLHSNPDLEKIYEDMINLGHNHVDIYNAINKIIVSNIKQAIANYKQRKNNG